MQKRVLVCLQTDTPRSKETGVLTFLRLLFVFLSYNFSRDFLQAPWEATSLMNVAVSFSRITFPCCVWHFVFGKRRRMTVFSYITFRFRLVNHGMKYGRNGKNCSIQWV